MDNTDFFGRIYAEKELLQMLLLGQIDKVCDLKEIEVVDEFTTNIYLAFHDPKAADDNPNSFALAKKVIQVTGDSTLITMLYADGKLLYENPLSIQKTTANYIPRKFMY